MAPIDTPLSAAKARRGSGMGDTKIVPLAVLASLLLELLWGLMVHFDVTRAVPGILGGWRQLPGIRGYGTGADSLTTWKRVVDRR
jgi:hypothetical protein